MSAADYGDANDHRRRDRHPSSRGSGDWHRRGDRRRSRSPRRGGPRFHRSHRDWDSIENSAQTGDFAKFGPPNALDGLSAAATQPPEKTFKEFVGGEPDDVTGEEAVKNYCEYRRNFEREQLLGFFEKHKNDHWFRDRYDPESVLAKTRELTRIYGVRARAMLEFEHIPKVESSDQDALMEYLDKVVGKIEEIEFRESSAGCEAGIDGEGGSSSKNGTIENEEEEGELDKSEQKSDQTPPDPSKFQSIFIRSLPMTVSREDLEKYFSSKNPRRIALSEPAPDRQFTRRAWVTFDENANLKEIVESITNDASCGFEGVCVNYEVGRRVRAVGGQILGDPEVVRKHLDLAERIVRILDEKWKPLGQQQQLINPFTQGKEDEIEKLDALIMYLRIVYSIDFYNGQQYTSEHQMPVRCGIVHLRGNGGAGEANESFLSELNEKLKSFVDEIPCLSDEQCVSLGLKDEQAEIDKFVETNCKKLGDERWLCPLCDKKFKAPDFVKKHVVNKHGDNIEKVRNQCKLFNGYVRDLKRPQLPPYRRRLQTRPGVKRSHSPAAIYTPPGKRFNRVTADAPQKLENLWDDRELVQYDTNTYGESDVK